MSCAASEEGFCWLAAAPTEGLPFIMHDAQASPVLSSDTVSLLPSCMTVFKRDNAE